MMTVLMFVLCVVSPFLLLFLCLKHSEYSTLTIYGVALMWPGLWCALDDVTLAECDRTTATVLQVQSSTAVVQMEDGSIKHLYLSDNKALILRPDDQITIIYWSGKHPKVWWKTELKRVYRSDKKCNCCKGDS